MIRMMSERDWLIVTTPTGEQVLDTVAGYCGLSEREITSKRRNGHLIPPRQLVMWLCTHLCGWPSTKIGRLLGGRDHTTVLYGVRRAEQRLGGRTPNDVWAALITNQEDSRHAFRG